MTRYLLVALVSWLGIGCAGSTVSPDAGPPTDARPTTDALLDVAASPDAGLRPCEPGLPADLCFLREEEKLARDVYLALAADSGLAIFDNISMSEQTHTDAVAAVLSARGIADPVTDDTPGAFIDPTLDALHTSLVEQGRGDAVAALRVGATIEDLDLHDIATFRSRTTEADALALYDALACGSRNHLRSFAMQLDSRGVAYTAQSIPADELAAILASPRETCGR
ncbi:MAG: DUF2202 domain-containing protein [Sandaracinus sp.]